MDIPAIIGDAVEYIEELKKKVKELEDELREIEEEEDLTKNKADVKILASDMRKEGSICLISTEHKQGSSSFVQKSPTVVRVLMNLASHLSSYSCSKLYIQYMSADLVKESTIPTMHNVSNVLFIYVPPCLLGASGSEPDWQKRLFD